MLLPDTFYAFLDAWVLLGIAIFFVLLFVNAPYGRFYRTGWGVGLPSSMNWFLMESIAVIVFAGIFLVSSPRTALHWYYFGLWNLHYVYRCAIYPWIIRSRQRVPLTITIGGVSFNLVNSWLQSTNLFVIAERDDPNWICNPLFVLGAVLFFSGFAIHVHADLQLRGLRNSQGPGYLVPHGGLFRWVSSANYFGELVEWIGWAILTWSWSGVAFVIWTAANLVPRALASHNWYRANFPDYPRERKAILPFLL